MHGTMLCSALFGLAFLDAVSAATGTWNEKLFEHCSEPLTTVDVGEDEAAFLQAGSLNSHSKTHDHGDYAPAKEEYDYHHQKSEYDDGAYGKAGDYTVTQNKKHTHDDYYGKGNKDWRLRRLCKSIPKDPCLSDSPVLPIAVYSTGGLLSGSGCDSKGVQSDLVRGPCGFALIGYIKAKSGVSSMVTVPGNNLTDKCDYSSVETQAVDSCNRLVFSDAACLDPHGRVSAECEKEGTTISIIVSYKNTVKYTACDTPFQNGNPGKFGLSWCNNLISELL